jgi:hypothetical protein
MPFAQFGKCFAISFVAGWFFYINVRLLARGMRRKMSADGLNKFRGNALEPSLEISSGSTSTAATSLSLNSRRSFTPCGEGGMLPTTASLNSCLQRRLSCECICQMVFSRTFHPKTAWARKALLHWHASKRWSSEALGWFGSRGHFVKIAARSRTTITQTWSKIPSTLNLRREVYRSYDSSFLSVKRFASLSIRAYGAHRWSRVCIGSTRFTGRESKHPELPIP